MSEKGASRIDKAAHILMEFAPRDVVGATTKGICTAFYHEERLFSVRNTETGIVSLVYARSPIEAIDRVKESYISEEKLEEIITAYVDSVLPYKKYVSIENAKTVTENLLKRTEDLHIAALLLAIHETSDDSELLKNYINHLQIFKLYRHSGVFGELVTIQ